MYTTKTEMENFLSEYMRSRVVSETSVRSSLNRVLEFEKKFKKAFYEFNTNEVLEMYKSVHAISERSLQNSNLILKHFSKWIVDVRKLDIDSIYESINRELIRDCVDIDKRNNLILTKKDLIDIQNELLNYTDKSILFMLFEGVGGHMLKELTFMDWEQVSRKDLKIYFKTGKVIDITPQDYELLRKGFFEDELISFGTTTRVSRTRAFGFYKARFNSLSDNSNINNSDDVNRRYRFIQRRLMLISQDLGISLTSGSVQDSGFLHYIKEGVENSGLSFLEYIKTEECKYLARRYDLYTDLYVQIVKEKFHKYFE